MGLLVLILFISQRFIVFPKTADYPLLNDKPVLERLHAYHHLKMKHNRQLMKKNNKVKLSERRAYLGEIKNTSRS